MRFFPLFLLAPLVALAQPATHAERIDAVERALVPRLVIENEPTQPVSLAERMEQLDVPGVSVAFFQGGEVVWTRGYGVADAEAGTRVTPETRFQAASISKPVAAMAALDLVEESRLSLDADVNEALQSWQVPADSFDAPVTLRGLLTHTAGLTVHGFGGYAEGDAVPSTVGVLDGAGNSDPVRVDLAPRTVHRYSGGGYTVAQLLVSDVTGQPFADVMAERVLRPLGMTHSTYTQPLPAALRANAATGYRADGSAVEGRFHTYPEQAAAGLWTTPTDLARWAIAVQRGLEPGGEHPVLDSATVHHMVSPDTVGGHGLGPGLSGDGLFFGHGGANEGFRCLLTAQLSGGQGIVVMTNSDTGGDLIDEIVRSVAREYGWEGHDPIRKRVVALQADVLTLRAGRYHSPDQPGLHVTIRAEGGELVALTEWDGREARLAAESATEFFDRANGTAVVFSDAPGTGFTVQDLRFERTE